VSKGLRVAVVGLNFGDHWLPGYLAHPDVASVSICDADFSLLSRVGDAWGIDRRFTDLEQVLSADDIDAVHLLTPLDVHAAHSQAVLAAGKHCAVAVTAALKMTDLQDIVDAQARSGLNYMMMETAAYTDAAVHVRRLVEAGQFGDIVFGSGEHHQEMSGWPGYWVGLPPMWYSTHALGPLLMILKTRAVSVRALGSGQLPKESAEHWGNPFPVETAIFDLEGSPVSLSITRSLFQTARATIESFSLFGTLQGFDWGRTHDEMGLLTSWGAPNPGKRGRDVIVEPFLPDDARQLLPEALRPVHGTIAGPVHEFVRSILESRRPAIDAVTAADWTAAGLAAHESAMSHGSVVNIPRFT
jgi:predicted dehydrogenase